VRFALVFRVALLPLKLFNIHVMMPRRAAISQEAKKFPKRDIQMATRSQLGASGYMYLPRSRSKCHWKSPIRRCHTSLSRGIGRLLVLHGQLPIHRGGGGDPGKASLLPP
jgi:hypothetical protein